MWQVLETRLDRPRRVAHVEKQAVDRLRHSHRRREIDHRHRADRFAAVEQGQGDSRSAARMAGVGHIAARREAVRSEEHTSELQSLMRISYAVFCLKKKTSLQMST